MDLTFSAANLFRADSALAESSGVSISPVKSVRSRTGSLRYRGTSGLYGGTPRLYIEVRIFLKPRRISSSSRKPSVVSIPTLAPRSVSRALVAKVVPWMINSSSPINSLKIFRSALAAFSRESMRPVLGSSGVVGALNWLSRPCLSRTRQSVKVPPTSIATRVIAYLLTLIPLFHDGILARRGLLIRLFKLIAFLSYGGKIRAAPIKYCRPFGLNLSQVGGVGFRHARELVDPLERAACVDNGAGVVGVAPVPH